MSVMHSNSRGASVSASPPLPEATWADKGGVRRATRRGSATSWLLPRSPTESPMTHDSAAAVSRHNSVQADDYRMLMSDSSSILSGVETVAPQSHRSSSEQSTRKGPYGLLTGLLSRRAADTKPRRSETGGQDQQRGGASQPSPLGRAKPSSRTVRNPLLEGYETAGNHASVGGTQIGAGGYDWPTPPSPIKAAESIHPPTSSSRHESSGSPMLSLASHSPLQGGSNVRPDRREKRVSSRFPDHGESHFVPLGSIELANRGGSASVRRPGVEEANADSALSTSTVTGRTSVVGRRKTFGHTAPTAASLSASESQSNEQLAHTRASQMRTAGTEENELSAPSSSSNVRSLRDAKAALLRHAQGVTASVRTSRAQSFRRVPSNAGGAEAVALPTHRSMRTRGTSRERRSLNGSRSGVGRDDGGSLYSIGLEDDAVRTSLSPGSMGSPMLSRPGVLFPATAVNQEGNMTSTSHVGASRRFSHTEEGSGAILEVMETSALTSRGNVNAGSNTAGSSGQTTRGRSTGSIAKSTNGRHGGNSSREDASHLPSVSNHYSSVSQKHRHLLTGGYSLSRTGGYGDSGDSEGSADMEERHRHKVDEVMRRLNRPQRSITGNNQSTMSRAAASETGGARNEVVAVLNTNGHSAEIGTSRGTSVDNNNSTSAGGAVGWSGVGGLGWGSLAGFGSAAADSTNDDTAGAGSLGVGAGGGGGWAGLGGDGGSDDWYARMRKKAEEEEQAEAATASAAAANAAAATLPPAADVSAVAAVRITSPATVSTTVGPGLVVTSNPPSGIVGTMSSTSEAPMPSVARGAGAHRSSLVGSFRGPAARVGGTPHAITTPMSPAALTPSRPVASARSPARPPLPLAPLGSDITHVSSLAEQLARRPHPPGSAPAASVGESPLDLPVEDLEAVDSNASGKSRADSGGSTLVSSGHQPTLPGMTTTAAPPARRASRSSALLAAAASPNAEAAVPGSDGDACAQLSKVRGNSGGGISWSARDSAGDSVGTARPTPPLQRAETLTPLSSNPSSVATTPGHRRFDFRRRNSLPRVLPVSTTGSATTTTTTTTTTNAASTATGGPSFAATTVSHNAVPLHGTRNGRMSLVSTTSIDTFGKGPTQPASPAASVSQNTRGVSRMQSANTTMDANVSGTESPFGGRRHSSPTKRSTAPFATVARAGSSGSVHPLLPPGVAPRKPEVAATKTRVIAASSRLSIS